MVNYLVVHQLGSKYSNLEIETEIEMSFLTGMYKGECSF